MARRQRPFAEPFKAAAPTKDGPRANRDIRVPRVQLIDADGQNRGDVSINKRSWPPKEAGLDLVEISPNAQPPVVKILDLGKLKYANQKKAAEARKNQKVIEIKEIKMRPNIDDHDYETKMKAVRRFFEEGDKVKLTLRFRGREMKPTWNSACSSSTRFAKPPPSPRSKPSRSSKAVR